MQLPAVHHPQHNVCFFRLDGEGFLVPLTAAPQELARLFDVERPLLEQLNQQDGAQLTQLRQQRTANRLALTIQDRRWQCHFAPVDEQHWLVSAYLEQHQQQDELGLIEWQLQQNRPSSANLAARIPTLIDSLIQQQGGDRVIIWRHYAHEELLRPLYSQGLSFNLQPVKAERRYLRTLLNRGGLSYSHCTQQPLLSAFYYLATDGIQHRLDVPIILNGKLAGILSVEYQQSRPPVTAADMQFVAAIATELAESLNELVPDSLASGSEPVPEVAASAQGLAHFPAPQPQPLDSIAWVDELTGLHNRCFIINYLQDTLAEQQGDHGALLLITIDEFNAINSALGYQLGEQLLIAVAERLKMFSAASHNTKLARDDNNEFMLVISHLGHNFIQAKTKVARLAQEVNELFLLPFLLDDLRLQVNISTGVSLFPLVTPTPLSYLHQADCAKQLAQRLPNSRYVMFDLAMAKEMRSTLKISKMLQAALKQQQWQLYFQPQLTMQDHSPLAIEALLYWPEQGQSLTALLQLHPFLRDSSLIDELEKWALYQLAARYQHWYQQGTSSLDIAIKISGRYFHSPYFITTVSTLLDRYPACRDRLTFEIAEAVFITEPDESRRQVTQLTALGVNVALGDFTGGYSSLMKITELSLKHLKISATYLQELEHHPQQHVILRSLFSLAKQLQMNVVADGVNTEQQRATLAGLDCPAIQGSLLAQGMPEHELIKWLATHTH